MRSLQENRSARRELGVRPSPEPAGVETLGVINLFKKVESLLKRLQSRGLFRRGFFSLCQGVFPALGTRPCEARSLIPGWGGQVLWRDRCTGCGDKRQSKGEGEARAGEDGEQSEPRALWVGGRGGQCGRCGKH